MEVEFSELRLYVVLGSSVDQSQETGSGIFVLRACFRPLAAEPLERMRRIKQTARKGKELQVKEVKDQMRYVTRPLLISGGE